MDRIAKIDEFLSGRYDVSDYPTLQYQFEEWSSTKPLAGLRVVDVTPLFKNTLLKYRALLASGAELLIGECSFISADPQVLNFCKNELKLEVVTVNNLANVDIILDCAASYLNVSAAVGYVELTGSGVAKYRDAAVRCYVADSSRIKLLETELGTGESFFRAMNHLGYGYQSWKGKRLVVFGSGKVGRGIVSYAKSYGADVVVVSNPQMPIAGVTLVDFRDPEAVDKVVCDAYCVVMATGVERAFERTVTVEKAISSGVLLANMGAEDEFGDSVPNDRVIEGKRTINFILDEPTHLRFIDATMALHNFGAEWLVFNPTAKGVVMPDEATEERFLEITRRNGKIGGLVEKF